MDSVSRRKFVKWALSALALIPATGIVIPAKAEEVTLIIDKDGNATLRGVRLIVDKRGNAAVRKDRKK